MLCKQQTELNTRRLNGKLSRLLSNKQGESDSIVNQRKLINNFSLNSRPEIEVVGEFVDDGVSGIIFDDHRSML